MSMISENCRRIEKEMVESLQGTERSREDVTVIAVTKMRTADEAEVLYKQNYRHFAENRPEGLLEKQSSLAYPDITWHYIGTLQTRKVKNVINQIDYFHALDRESLAKEIDKRAEQPVSCFVQVNVTGETSKHGVSPDDLNGFIETLADFPKVRVVGLMTMAPIAAEEQELRECFRKLKELQSAIEEKQLPYAPCKWTSMGMSNDYSIAIQEGAHFVRIGTAFFEENKTCEKREGSS